MIIMNVCGKWLDGDGEEDCFVVDIFYALIEREERIGYCNGSWVTETERIRGGNEFGYWEG